MKSAQDLVKTLKMQPHPEGGWYVETFRDPAQSNGRSVGTAIYYLLEAGQHSHWHRVDAAEIWHYYAGAPLRLGIAQEGAPNWSILGTDFSKGERPQIIVPAGDWQAAESTGEWTLVGCTVSPGFDFSGFEMAEPGFEPGQE